jgi:hypothetical protein
VDQVVTDTGQFDRFGVIRQGRSTKAWILDVDIKDQAAGMSIRYHALHPEKRRNT